MSDQGLKMSLEILKYCSIAVGTTSGLLGTITQTRDKETGKLTRWGKHMVVLIAVSGVVTTAIQSVESYLKSRSDAEYTAAQNESSTRIAKILTQADVLKTQLDAQNKSLGSAVTGIGDTTKQLQTVYASQNRVLHDTYAMLHPLGKLHLSCSIEIPFSGPVILNSHWYAIVKSPEDSERFPEWGPAKEEDPTLYAMLHGRLLAYFNKPPRHGQAKRVFESKGYDLYFRSENVESSLHMLEENSKTFINNVSATMVRGSDNQKIATWEDLQQSELVVPLPVAYSPEAELKSCRFVFGGPTDAEQSTSLDITFNPSQRQTQENENVFYVVSLSKLSAARPSGDLPSQTSTSTKPELR